MKKILLFLFLLAHAYAYPPLPEPANEEEALFIRRIVNFWRDQDYTFVKDQMLLYLQKEPKGAFAEHFYAMLGDISLHEKGYPQALEYYAKVSQKEIKSEIQTKKWQALYLMGAFSEIYQEIKPIVSHVSDDGKFYFAESAFREAILFYRNEETEESAQNLFLEALPVYEALQNNKAYGAHAKLAMAEIYRATEQPKEAARLYLELAEEKKDDTILFHAAISLLQYDSAKALSIFKILAKKGHPKASLHFLELLAQDKKWDEILKERTLFTTNLAPEDQALAYFYLGIISYEKQDFLNATLDLSKAFEKGLQKPHDRTAFLALMKSAKELKKVDICDKTFQRLKITYPENACEGQFILASAYDRAGNSKKALFLFDELTKNESDYELCEKAFLEKARLLAKEKDWKGSHETILTFLNRFPNSSIAPKMSSLAVEISLAQLAHEEVYEQLALDIERGLSLKAFDKVKEKKELLAKAYLKLERVEEALKLTEEIEDPDPLLLTQCYVQEKKSPAKIVEHGEKALSENPENDFLHLHLFNAYLALAKENEDESFTKIAAAHLNSIIETYPVSTENWLWLARYFAKENDPRAFFLLESMLQTEINLKRFDEEALILAELYRKHQVHEKARPLLEKVVTLKQKTEPRAKLLLGEIYLETNEIEKAKTLYEALELSAAPCISCQARLQLARLCFSEDPEKCLKKLQELKTRKSLASEPSHLEAALDHAELKSSLLPDDQKEVEYLSYLLQIKEEFSTQETICAKDYHASREMMPDKEQIYQAYMRYLDGKIYLLQSKLTTDEAEKKVKESAAKALFLTLKQGKFAVSNYLVKKATQYLHETP